MYWKRQQMNHKCKVYKYLLGKHHHLPNEWSSSSDVTPAYSMGYPSISLSTQTCTDWDHFVSAFLQWQTEEALLSYSCMWLFFCLFVLFCLSFPTSPSQTVLLWTKAGLEFVRISPPLLRSWQYRCAALNRGSPLSQSLPHSWGSRCFTCK